MIKKIVRQTAVNRVKQHVQNRDRNPLLFRVVSGQHITPPPDSHDSFLLLSQLDGQCFGAEQGCVSEHLPVSRPMQVCGEMFL